MTESMARVIAFLIAVPALYGIVRFYARLARALWRLAQRPKAAAMEPAYGNGPSQDARYETALAAAQGIIRQFEEAPGLSRHEQLASVTYAILEAMRRSENLQQGDAVWVEASMN